MSQSVKPVPAGHHTVTPYLVVKDVPDAIAFYEKAFGAAESYRMACPETGMVMHAEVKIGDSLIYMGQECLSYGVRSAETLGGSPVGIHLYVEDADAVAAKAAEAGATLVMPVSEMFWGDRYGKLVDPFGHVWSVATHVEDLTPEQMAERMAAAMAERKAAALEPAGAAS